MRMWMQPVDEMCLQHRSGEHNEYHKHEHNWRKRHSIAGRVAGNAIEPLAYKRRHDELAATFAGHKTPIEQPDFSYLPPEHLNARVDVEAARKLLHARCPKCRALWEEKHLKSERRTR